MILFLSILFFYVKPLNLNVTDFVTTSGISSGAFMAVQFQVAHSALVKGTGVIAGGPYYCAENLYLTMALTACMKDPKLIDVSVLIDSTKYFALMTWIDDLRNLKDRNIYLFSGTKDTEVHQGVMEKLDEMLMNLNVRNITRKFNIPAEHAMITDYYGSECGYFGPPYINNCGFDLAGEILKSIHFLDGKFNPRADKINNNNFFKFPQNKLLTSMNDFGIAYVPTACQNGELCSLHVDYHGCEMYYDEMKLKYVTHSGYARWAETNNIIIISPQTKKNEALNPKGCFDWWGYAGVNYCIKLGEQVLASREWVQDFLDNTIKLTKF